ncbi:MAG: DedA family protein [Candidatus Berkelbacteria bacterium]|nr:DedA family protein [Candidatus Berkelbacteria bacterium]
MTAILSFFSHFIINTISSMGYFGVAVLMAIGAFNIPLPSEVILPFSGFLVWSGQFNLFLVALFACLGWLFGAFFSYYLGIYGGRPLINRFGKYVLLSHHDLDNTEKFFAKYGEIAVFVGQLLPIVRNFISLAAGISKLKFWKFISYTLAGAFLWALLLTWIGVKLGENWDLVKVYFHKFDVLIAVLIVLAIALYIWRHIKNSKNHE